MATVNISKKALHRRTRLYSVETVGFRPECDYLTSGIEPLELQTIGLERVAYITDMRLDIISLKYYGSYHYAWLIMEHNNILDPWNELKIGDLLKIPSLEEYFYFTKQKKRQKLSKKIR